MKTLFTRELHTIGAGQLLSGVADQAKTLQVEHGQVWLTVEGELDDYWLGSGDTLVLPAGRNIVLEADGSASVVTTRNNTTHSPQASFWSALAARLAAGLHLPGQSAHC